ncbi:glycosyltransferase family 2 protein [Paenibacillus albiflavus]|uniref:Glycosyltransferase family 2 protein n=1 Tax=Paenibacillus albiflavus TaxID=2545760 RepID=A0A4V2WNU1_9BACL|nr:glycosyltransferase family 2 protein [Paenibacillus albiflavus]TCZ76852.1 glycosyltransferase family 2 protein [Paenibacillus albiflavus]
MDKLISLCMIVKNEEKTLSRCLDSVQGLVDEIIIVDTGSIDTTKQIAKRYTNQVYDYEWTNDFSAARNESIRRATSEWILILDADEYIERDDIDVLRHYLPTIKNESISRIALTIPITSFVGGGHNVAEGYVARIFPNNSGITFIRPIHEQLSCDSGELEYRSFSFYVYHTGYTQETMLEKNKSQRNLKILEQYSSNHKLEPYDYYTIGNEYKMIKDYENAYINYMNAFKGLSSATPWYVGCLISLIDCLFGLDRMKEVNELIESKLVQWKQYPEYFAIKARWFNQLGFYDEARVQYEEAVQIAEKLSMQNIPFWLISSDYGRIIPFNQLVQYYSRKQDLSQTVFYLIKVLNDRPYHYLSLIKLINLLVQTESIDAILQLLYKLYPNRNSVEIGLLFQVSLEVGNLSLSNHFFGISQEMSIDISPSQMLQFAVLTGDQDKYIQIMKNLDLSSDMKLDIILPLVIASVRWREPDYLLVIANDPTFYQLYILASACINEEELIISPTDEEVDMLMRLFIELFNYKLYEEYDLLLKRVSSSMLINSLANYYYTHHHLELALDYYSILLDSDELNAEGYEHLAHLHLNQGEKDDGLKFLGKASELRPDDIVLYTNMWLNCKDSLTRLKYKNELFRKFPHYVGIPIFNIK